MNLPATMSGGPVWMPQAEGSRTDAMGQSLRHIVAAVWRNLWLALAIIAVCLGIAFVMTMLERPSYSGVASVQINDQTDEVLGEDLEGERDAGSDWDIDRFLNTQLDILRSRTLSERVANSLNLYDDARFFDAMGIENPPGHPESEVRRDLVINMLIGSMDVDLPRESRIARIGFTSYDPEISARVANSFAEEFIQANLQRRYDSSSYARNFVAEQLEEARLDLENSERDLNEYARQAGLLRSRNPASSDRLSTDADSVTAASLVQLNEAAIASRAQRADRRARWTSVSQAPLLTSQEELNNPTVQSLMTRRSDAEAQLQTARDRYLPDHPSIERLESELSAINAQLTAAARNVRNSIQADYQAAVSANQDLERQVLALRGETLEEQDLSVRYNTLARQADTARSIYDGLLQRYRELNASAGIAASNIAIIDHAEVPAGPSSPNMRRALALALLLGIGLAGVAVFLRDQFDDVIHVPEDVEEKLEMPLLGVIPSSPRRRPLADLGDPHSVVSEAYASLRGSLLYSTPQGLPKLLGVTSALDGEGKSTTSFAIAVGLARLGMRVLLIDADLRRPSIHHMVGRDNDRGLTDLLSYRKSYDEALLDMPDLGFDILTAGPLPATPSELLASPRMAQLLEACAQGYDVTVIDGPPILGLADAPMLAAIVDGTVFVVEPERARSGQLKAALKRLRSVRPVLLGAVLAKFDANKNSNYYSAYSGKGYYQYQAGGKRRIEAYAAPETRERASEEA